MDFARVCQSLQTQSVKEVEMPEYTLLLVDGTDIPDMQMEKVTSLRKFHMLASNCHSI